MANTATTLVKFFIRKKFQLKFANQIISADTGDNY